VEEEVDHADDADDAGRHLDVGFGWSFYGFFLAAAAWMALYFVWAFAADDSKRTRRR
jgi:hypothetical protein